jgi:hypothetical protein
MNSGPAMTPDRQSLRLFGATGYRWKNLKISAKLPTGTIRL